MVSYAFLLIMEKYEDKTDIFIDKNLIKYLNIKVIDNGVFICNLKERYGIGFIIEFLKFKRCYIIILRFHQTSVILREYNFLFNVINFVIIIMNLLYVLITF